jgi:hypothetical protein
MRVCQRLGISCMSIELDKNYCKHIAEENGLIQVKDNLWEDV